MRNYDKIDPEQYERRHEKSPREGYLGAHWRPLIQTNTVLSESRLK